MNKHVPTETMTDAMSTMFGANPEAFATAAKRSAKVMEDFVRGSQTIGERVLVNSANNTCDLLKPAQAIASAKTVPEALQLQVDFMQKQFSKAMEQGQELLSLSTKAAQDAFQAVTAAAVNGQTNGKSH